MKKVTNLLLVLLLFSVANAQKVYFVYLQSENEQSFYARMGEKTYNSSVSGYMILSNLRDSIYSMNIGVQGSQLPEQLFSVTVNKKDQGFLVKNFGEKGWGLFNFQSMAVIMPAPINAVNVVKTEKRETNAFTDLLAKAADDSTLKERPVIEKVEKKKVEEPVQLQEKKEEPKKETRDTVSSKAEEKKKIEIPAEKKEESKKEIRDTISAKPVEAKRTKALVEKKEDIKAEVNPIQQAKTEEKTLTPSEQSIEKKTDENSKVELYQKSMVTKRSESSTTEGFSITFLDVYANGTVDTVKILIPAEKQKAAAVDSKKENMKFLDIVIQDTVQKKIDVEQNDKKIDSTTKSELPVKQLKKNNNCSQTATDDDFFNLRKKMAAEMSNDNMINEAKKIFTTKCFTTQQIRNLSVLFLSDEGKYKFFDASYDIVSDSGNFGLLQSELKDEYYINRFKAMLHN